MMLAVRLMTSSCGKVLQWYSSVFKVSIAALFFFIQSIVGHLVLIEMLL